MIFIDDCVMQNYPVRKENEEFPESTVFVLENLNFKPHEFAYVEPEKLPEKPEPTEEEKKEEEAKAQLAAAQAKGGKQPPAPAKMTAAEKKKQEEALKK